MTHCGSVMAATAIANTGLSAMVPNEFEKPWTQSQNAYVFRCGLKHLLSGTGDLINTRRSTTAPGRLGHVQ